MLQVELVVVMANVVVSIISSTYIYASNFAQGVTIGNGAATIHDSGGACTGGTTGSQVLYVVEVF